MYYSIKSFQQPGMKSNLTYETTTQTDKCWKIKEISHFPRDKNISNEFSSERGKTFLHSQGNVWKTFPAIHFCDSLYEIFLSWYIFCRYNFSWYMYDAFSIDFYNCSMILNDFTFLSKHWDFFWWYDFHDIFWWYFGSIILITSF